MKKVLTIIDQQQTELEELYKNRKTNRVRRRSHLILLSGKNKFIKELHDILCVHRDTVCSTIDNFNEYGIKGIDKYRSGRPLALTKEEDEFVLKKVAKDSRNLKKILFKLKTKFNKLICKVTLIRFL